MVECEFIGKKFLIERFKAPFNLSDIIELKSVEFKHELYSKQLRLLIFFGDIRIQELKDIEWFTDFFRKHQSKIEGQKIAILAPGSLRKLLRLLFLKKSHFIQNLNIDIHFPESKKEAYQWLEIPDDLVIDD